MNYDHDIRVMGTTWGSPYSSRTYSGVPGQVFSELHARGKLVGWQDIDFFRWTDIATGAISLRRSLTNRRPRRSATWRYEPRSIAVLSDRVRTAQAEWYDHNAVLQFGVGGIPDPSVPLVAHIEISVRVAASTPVFAKSYGFDKLSDDKLERLCAGERRFIQACSYLWTNTSWTAQGLIQQGVDPNRLLIVPPPCGLEDPGLIERDWNRVSLLFVGQDWHRKGGPLLVRAFEKVRRTFPDARLTIVGCNPDVAAEGIHVLGYLSKDDPAHRRTLDQAFREATLFVLPSAWESTGIVYMEAALYGLPSLMLAGQGRDALFPRDMAIIAEADADSDDLADLLLRAARDRTWLEAMGRAGRQHVLRNYTTPSVVDRLESVLASSVASRAS